MDMLSMSPAKCFVISPGGFVTPGWAVSGTMRRPRCYSRRLMRVFYMSAMVAARSCPPLPSLLHTQ
jgi:hypothetical protein